MFSHFDQQMWRCRRAIPPLGSEMTSDIEVSPFFPFLDRLKFVALFALVLLCATACENDRALQTHHNILSAAAAPLLPLPVSRCGAPAFPSTALATNSARCPGRRCRSVLIRSVTTEDRGRSLCLHRCRKLFEQLRSAASFLHRIFCSAALRLKLKDLIAAFACWHDYKWPSFSSNFARAAFCSFVFTL